jgi:hypothetical protein
MGGERTLIHSELRLGNMVAALLRTGFNFGPLLFGLLFIPPVTAQVLDGVGLAAPFGLTPLAAGFVLGGLWGLYAQWRGSWLSWQL